MKVKFWILDTDQGHVLTLPAVPRVGDDVELDDTSYTVGSVTWTLDVNDEDTIAHVVLQR